MLPFLQGVARRPPEGLSSRADVGIRPYTRFFGGRFRRGRCPRSGAKRNKYPWGASPRTPRQRCHSEPVTDVTGVGIRSPFYASGGLFSFNSERKEEKKRRQKLRFWISLRGFAWYLSCQNKPRERCAMQTSPKCCIVSAPLSAAAFALKYRRISFYRGRDQRQRRRRRGDPFDRTTKSNFRDRVAQTTDNHRP